MTIEYYGGKRFRLYPPGTRKGNKVYWARVRWSNRDAEISTGAATEADAVAHIHRFIDALNLRDEHARRLLPAAVELGEFEEWLLKACRLSGESVIGPNGRALSFYSAADGYRQVRIAFGQHIKSVYEHRIKFLLAHGWLPASIDHVNRVRHDNRIENLRAATPAQQTKNRSLPVRNLDAIGTGWDRPA